VTDAVYTTDPALDVPMWLGLDLQRAYAYRDRAAVAALLSGREPAQVDLVVCVLIENHNETLRILSATRRVDLGGRALLAEIDQVAGLAPAEHEFTVTTAVRRFAAGHTDLTSALAELAPVDRAHTLAVYITAANLAAFSRKGYQRLLEDTAAMTERELGKPRPYPQPIPA
jgi:hypothetical protein